mmetsp:Transcript_101995/g.285922  ORF Transcript_101995/g.285922 Transcript_101995/m.285922 type:complete len:218 (+) Transcript_101995:72-725(+)
MLPGEVACTVAGRRAALWLRAGRATGLGILMMHPHPHFGGNMEDDRVVAILRELHLRDAVVATLRFDFSSDLSAGPASIEAGCKLIREQPNTDAIAMAGYSYGSAALCELLCAKGAGLLAEPKPLRSAVFLAPPLGMMLPGKEEAVAASLSRIVEAGLGLTIVAGSQDSYCTEAELRAWHADLGATALHVVDGADHFFSSTPWLREAVAAVVGNLLE